MSRAYEEKKLQLQMNWQVGTHKASLEDGSDFPGVKNVLMHFADAFCFYVTFSSHDMLIVSLFSNLIFIIKP